MSYNNIQAGYSGCYDFSVGTAEDAPLSDLTSTTGRDANDEEGLADVPLLATLDSSRLASDRTELFSSLG